QSVHQRDAGREGRGPRATAHRGTDEGGLPGYPGGQRGAQRGLGSRGLRGLARMVRFPLRGEVYWVDLDPTVGSDISRTRPCLIISNDMGNQYSARVIVAPLTTGGADRAYPFEVLVTAGEGGLERSSK